MVGGVAHEPVTSHMAMQRDEQAAVSTLYLPIFASYLRFSLLLGYSVQTEPWHSCQPSTPQCTWIVEGYTQDTVHVLVTQYKTTYLAQV